MAMAVTFAAARGFGLGNGMLQELTGEGGGGGARGRVRDREGLVDGSSIPCANTTSGWVWRNVASPFPSSPQAGKHVFYDSILDGMLSPSRADTFLFLYS